MVFPELWRNMSAAKIEWLYRLELPKHDACVLYRSRYPIAFLCKEMLG